MVESKIMSRTASAGLALSASQLLGKVIDFALVLVLARLLTPEDFALIAIAMIFVQLTEAVLQMPVAQILVRTPRVTRDMLYTAFTVSFLRSLIVVAIILVLTPVTVWMFDEPRLYALMPVLSLAPALRGMVNPKLTLFARRLNFYPEAAISILSRAVTAAIALPFAIATESYWALVLMTVISPTLLTVMSFIYLPFRPKFSLKSWNVFANMVGWSTLAQTFGAANWQVKVFVLAQYATRATTGNYSVASNLNGIVQHSIVEPLIRPFVSTFSLLQKNNALQGGYLVSSRALFMAAGPVFVVLVVLADPIILFLFGGDWVDAPVFLQVLAISALFIVSTRPAAAVAYAQDKTIYIAIANGVAFVATALLLWLGYVWYDLPGFLVGHVLSGVVQMIAGMWMVKRLIELNYLAQLETLVAPTLAMLVMAMSLHLALPLIQTGGHVALFFSIGAVAVSGVLVYLMTVLLIWILRGRPDGLEKSIVSALTRTAVKP